MGETLLREIVDRIPSLMRVNFTQSQFGPTKILVEQARRLKRVHGPPGSFRISIAMIWGCMARVYVCEASAKGIGGHYLEYCIRAAQSLSQYYTSKIVVHRKFDAKDLVASVPPFEIIPHFKTGYFEFPFHSVLERLFQLRKRRAYIFSTIFSRKTPITLVIKSSLADFIFRRYSQLTKILILSVIIFLSILVLIYETKVFTLISLTIIILVVLLRKKLVKNLKFLKMKAVSKNQAAYWFIHNQLLYSKSISRYFDLRTLIKRQNLGEEDVIFLTSASFFDLKAVLRLKKNRRVSSAIWIMLRREHDDWGIKNHQWRYIGSILKQHTDIKFFSDTELLQSEYSKLLNIDVNLLPIISSHSGNRKRGKKFLMSYLGDVREEKGFAGFLNLVKSQNNLSKTFFSHSYTPSKSTAEDLYFQSELNQIDNIEILDRPATTDEYFRLLSLSETVYLNYDSNLYKSRSSGIFVETVHAGSVPLVSQQTWMHKQISEVSRRYHRNLCKKRNLKTVMIGSKIRCKSKWFILRTIGSPNQSIELVLKSNFGLTYNLYGWSDENGVAYIPSPFLHESELEVTVEKGSSTFIRSVQLFYCPNNLPRWLGGIVLSSKNNAIAGLNEYSSHENHYINSLENWKSFKEFHSEAMFSRVLRGSL